METATFPDPTTRPAAGWLRRWSGVALVPVALLAILTAIDAAFLALSDAPRHVLAAERLLALAGDAERVLSRLIEQDEVTWDPTNGSRMGTVLSHLRRAEGMPVLVLGSSQLITLRDDRRLDAHPRRVDKVLERLAPVPTTVYNLSVGAMTTAEKALVLDRALATERFADVLVALTPWDSLEVTVRRSLGEIPDRPARGPREDDLDAATPAGPARVNRAVERVLREKLAAHVGFFARRSAIRAWLTGLGGEPPAPGPPAPDPRDARPVEYRWTGEEQRRIEENTLGLVAHLALRSREHGFHGFVLVTPRRPDAEHPLYDREFEQRYLSLLEAACERQDLVFIDASDLLDDAHFGVYELGELRGRIDGFHFDARGHERLARRLAGALWGDSGALAAQRLRDWKDVRRPWPIAAEADRGAATRGRKPRQAQRRSRPASLARLRSHPRS
jgi:hypothetical protein